MNREHRPEAGGNQAVKVILIVCGLVVGSVMLVCGGGAFLVYWRTSTFLAAAIKAAEQARKEEEAAEALREEQWQLADERDANSSDDEVPFDQNAESADRVSMPEVDDPTESPFKEVSPPVEAMPATLAPEQDPFQPVPEPAGGTSAVRPQPAPPVEVNPFAPLAPSAETTAAPPVVAPPAPTAAAELEAAKQFKLAEKFAKFKDAEPYRKRLREIVERWPGTKAATEADLILKAEPTSDE